MLWSLHREVLISPKKPNRQVFLNYLKLHRVKNTQLTTQIKRDLFHNLNEEWSVLSYFDHYIEESSFHLNQVIFLNYLKSCLAMNVEITTRVKRELISNWNSSSKWQETAPQTSDSKRTKYSAILWSLQNSFHFIQTKSSKILCIRVWSAISRRTDGKLMWGERGFQQTIVPT